MTEVTSPPPKPFTPPEFVLDKVIPFEANMASIFMEPCRTNKLVDEKGEPVEARKLIATALGAKVEEVNAGVFNQLRSMRVIWVLSKHLIDVEGGNRSPVFSTAEAETLLQVMAPARDEIHINFAGLRSAMAFLTTRVVFNHMVESIRLGASDETTLKSLMALQTQAGYSVIRRNIKQNLMNLISSPYADF